MNYKITYEDIGEERETRRNVQIEEDAMRDEEEKNEKRMFQPIKLS